MVMKGHPAKRKGKYTAKGKRENHPYVTNNIKSWRGRRVMTQEELAEVIGVTRVTISNWETGAKNPSDKYKVALCKALGCSLYDLFNWEV